MNSIFLLICKIGIILHHRVDVNLKVHRKVLTERLYQIYTIRLEWGERGPHSFSKTAA